ncbi:hypothetical protein EYS14_19300 [Alteromonadaceae bacterium M269]|nr:hypothetical protein EYS14_19300 [Alteromonadaceae bacterium M269]
MTDKPEADATSESNKPDDVTTEQQQKLDALKQQVSESKAQEKPKASPEVDSSAATKKAEKQPSSRRKPTETKQPKTIALWIFSILNLLLILGLAGGGYWFWQQIEGQKQQAQNSVNEQFRAQQQRLDNVLAQSLERQNNATANALSPVFDQLNSTSLKADAIQNRINEISGRRPSDWLLAEADYLVRMAGRKLWLEQDTQTAILMLQTADQRLADINDPSLIPIRELVAKDIVNLQQINQVPTTAIALKITGLIKSIDSMPIAMMLIPNSFEEEEDQNEITDSVSDWKENLLSSWKKVLDIKVYDRVVEETPLLSEQQQWLTREKLKYNLLLAQSALLASDKTLYIDYINQSVDSLRFFESDNYQVVGFREQLIELSQLDISRNYPSELESSAPLEGKLRDRINTPSERIE